MHHGVKIVGSPDADPAGGPQATSRRAQHNITAGKIDKNVSSGPTGPVFCFSSEGTRQ